MARTVLNVRLIGASPSGDGGVQTYTVPAGKFAVVAVHNSGGAGTGPITISGVTGPLSGSFNPLVLNAGDVVSFTTGTGSLFLTGFLYDL